MISRFLKVDVVLEDLIAFGKELKLVTMDKFRWSASSNNCNAIFLLYTLSTPVFSLPRHPLLKFIFFPIFLSHYSLVLCHTMLTYRTLAGACVLAQTRVRC